MEKEIWKQIEGYEDYHISNHGRVKSFKQYKEGKILKTNNDKDGYQQLNLFKNKNKKTHTIHRLVAESFIKNPKFYDQINHKDEDKTNNYFKNLEWCNNQYNTEYSNSKKYKILFPDNHEEIVFNLNKFCRINNLSQGNLYNTIFNGCFHKRFKILEKIDKDGIVIKSKQLKLKSYRILYPDNHEEIIFNLTEFSKRNNLDRNCMHRTLRKDCFHRGFKIIEKTN